MNLRKINLTLAVLLSIAGLASCGGGGGSSSASTSSSSQSSVESYQAAMTIGEIGNLEIDKARLTYKFEITSSSYGLVGTVFSGNLTDNGDGTYNIVGERYAKIFTYDNYSIMTLRVVKSDTRFAALFASRPGLNDVSSVYIPLVALRGERTLRTVDEITSNGASLEFKSVAMGTNKVGSDFTYSAEGTRGTIVKVSDTEFKVNSCSNIGETRYNDNLKSSNCTGSLVSTTTYTFEPSSNSWVVTPIDSRFPSQKVRAYFVNDVSTNQVIGFVDTSDTTMASSGFRIASVVPANTPVPTRSSGTFTITSYQSCTSSNNCGDYGGEWGIWYDNTMPNSSGKDEVKYHNGVATCIEQFRKNNPVEGFSTAITTGYNGHSCMESGNRPDTISIVFGLKSVNGKNRGLSADVGYDMTVSGPSQKFMLGNFVDN